MLTIQKHNPEFTGPAEPFPCPFCGRPGYTRAGLRWDRCPAKKEPWHVRPPLLTEPECLTALELLFGPKPEVRHD